MTWNGHDQYVVVWANEPEPGSGWSVVGQRFSAGGQPLGGEFEVTSTLATGKPRPDIAASGDGGFIITWSQLQSGEPMNLLARRFDRWGQPLNHEIGIFDEPGNWQGRGPLVAAHEDGSFVVAWSGGPQQYHISANADVIDADDHHVAHFTLGENDWGYYNHMSADDVVAGANGSFQVVWSHASYYESTLFLTTIAADGTTTRNVVTEENTPSECNADGAITRAGEQGFVVVWSNECLPESSPFTIAGQQLDQDGEPVGTTKILGGGLHDSLWRTNPALATLSGGDPLVVWDETVDADRRSPTHVVARIFNLNGFRGFRGLRSIRIDQDSEGDAYNPAVAADDDGGAAVVWVSTDGDLSGVFARFLGRRELEELAPLPLEQDRAHE